ncbi:MAG: elongation factor P [Planctomycetota bacterium]
MADIVTPNDFKRGMCIKHKGQLWYIVSYARGRTGMRRPYVNTKMKNVETGRVAEETFAADDKFEFIYMDKRPMQFLYRSGDKYVFMDMETYEQPELEAEVVDDMADLMVDNAECFFTIAEDRVIAVELPDFVELTVTQADPHLKGDTAGAEYRKVTVETGAEIMVPTHIKEGDKIQIDTRERTYVKRVNS